MGHFPGFVTAEPLFCRTAQVASVLWNIRWEHAAVSQGGCESVCLLVFVMGFI